MRYTWTRINVVEVQKHDSAQEHVLKHTVNFQLKHRNQHPNKQLNKQTMLFHYCTSKINLFWYA